MGNSFSYRAVPCNHLNISEPQRGFITEQLIVIPTDKKTKGEVK